MNTIVATPLDFVLRKVAKLHRDEHGASMAEYLVLLALIAITLFVTVSWFAGQVGDLFGADCSAGSWEKVHIGFVENGDKKQALDTDAKGNNDGVVCVKVDANTGKQLPGGGNMGNNQNVKDNS